MKRLLVHAVFAASLMLGTALASGPVLAAAAQSDQPKVSHAVGEQLSQAQQAMQKKDFQGAMADIKAAQAVPNLTDADNYMINQFLSVVAINLNDHPTALKALEAMAASPALPASMKQGTLHNLVLLENEAKNYQAAINYGQQLTALGPLDGPSAGALASAYYLSGNYPHAQELSQKIVDADIAAGQKPDQQLLQILMSSQVKQNNQAGAQKTLEMTTLYYGTPQNWGQLIDFGLSTPGVKNVDALDLCRLRSTLGAMKSDDVTMCAQFAQQLGYPGEALSWLQKGGGGGSLLSQAENGVAQDKKTLPGFAAQAAKSSGGELGAKLAETYYGYGRYQEAQTAIQSALGKGGIKDPSQAQMVYGMIQVALNDYAGAQKTFAGVTGTPARTKAAHIWGLYAQSKAQPATAAAPAQAPAPAQPQQ